MLLSAYLPFGLYEEEAASIRLKEVVILFGYIWNDVLSSGLPSTTQNWIEWLQKRWWQGSGSVQLGAEKVLWGRGERKDGTQQILSICMTKWEIMKMTEPDIFYP